MNIIEVENVSKSFKGQWALKNVSLSVEKGSICGIIGRNGSGKSVLFKCICGFYKIDEGEIRVSQQRIGIDVDVIKNAGVIIEAPGFLNNISGYHNLKYLLELGRNYSKKNVNNALDMVGLSNAKNKKVGKYSMGMKQRLAIAQAIMENPLILILDEPTNGLDNKGVEDVRCLLHQLKNEGKTILLSSHNSEDIRLLCDKVYEMDNGFIFEKEG